MKALTKGTRYDIFFKLSTNKHLCIISNQFTACYILSESIHHIQQRTVCFSAERNTIKASGEICHVDLSHTSTNEISTYSLLCK